MDKQTTDLLDMIRDEYNRRVEEGSNYSDLFFESLASSFEPPKYPNKPVIVAIWCDFEQYNEDQFPRDFAKAVLSNTNYDNFLWLRFQDGYALVEVCEDAAKGLARMTKLVQSAIEAAKPWPDAEWGVVTYQE